MIHALSTIDSFHERLHTGPEGYRSHTRTRWQDTIRGIYGSVGYWKLYFKISLGKISSFADKFFFFFDQISLS